MFAVQSSSKTSLEETFQVYQLNKLPWPKQQQLPVLHQGP